jgi:hypothetical protein
MKYLAMQEQIRQKCKLVTTFSDTRSVCVSEKAMHSAVKLFMFFLTNQNKQSHSSCYTNVTKAYKCSCNQGCTLNGTPSKQSCIHTDLLLLKSKYTEDKGTDV